MNNHSDDDKLVVLLAEYTHLYFTTSPAPQLAASISSGSFGLKGDWEGSDESYQPGVYVLFSAQGKALYIGKSSKNIGSRLVRFRRTDVGWDVAPATVRMITVTNYYEAPSLEEFLIERLQSSFNTVGAGKR